ncbi:unnamed protein product [Thlaspi arvense]|uniref:Uncharacterized protein n=1 Tax=Thlaspi arvense TaxID=13288 RepID=A0AAU9SJI3_THLAR|nr:unnamed protein product [Thlaspi arvense]
MSQCLYSNPTFSATLPICFAPSFILSPEYDSSHPASPLSCLYNLPTMRFSKRHFSPSLSLCISVLSSRSRFPGKYQAPRQFLHSAEIAKANRVFGKSEFSLVNLGK